MEEQKKRRGRPATGRVRDKMVGVYVTRDEESIIKNAVKEWNFKSIAEMVLYLIEEHKKDC